MRDTEVAGEFAIRKCKIAACRIIHKKPHTRADAPEAGIFRLQKGELIHLNAGCVLYLEQFIKGRQVAVNQREVGIDNFISPAVTHAGDVLSALHPAECQRAFVVDGAKIFRPGK